EAKFRPCRSQVKSNKPGALEEIWSDPCESEGTIRLATTHLGLVRQRLHLVRHRFEPLRRCFEPLCRFLVLGPPPRRVRRFSRCGIPRAGWLGKNGLRRGPYRIRARQRRTGGEVDLQRHVALATRHRDLEDDRSAIGRNAMSAAPPDRT